MVRKTPHPLSRRERQIMDILYCRGRASVTEVMNDLPDPPTYSAVRALLAILEKKGHVKHTKEGARYIYRSVQSRHSAGRFALKRILQTFYDGSIEKVVAALLDVSDTQMTETELDRLSRLIQQTGKEETKS